MSFYSRTRACWEPVPEPVPVLGNRLPWNRFLTGFQEPILGPLVGTPVVMVVTEWVSVHRSAASTLLPTASEIAFRWICVFQGLDSEAPRTSWKRRAQRVFPAINLVLSMFSIPSCVWNVLELMKGASFMYITIRLSNSLFLGCSFYAALLIVNSREEIRSLLQTKTRLSQNVILTLVCAVPFFPIMYRQISSVCCVPTVMVHILC